MNEITLNWKYFDSFEELSNSNDKLNKKGGVYFLIAKTTPNRIFYIGKTSDFLKRFSDHFTNQLSGHYSEHFFNKKEDLLKFWYEEIFKNQLTVTSASLLNRQLTANFTMPVKTDHQEFNLKKVIPPKERLFQRIEFINSFSFAIAELKPEFRSEVESLLQIQTEKAYREEINSKYKLNLKYLVLPGQKSNNFLIGTKTKNPININFKLKHEGDFQKLPIDVRTVLSPVQINDSN